MIERDPRNQALGSGNRILSLGHDAPHHRRVALQGTHDFVQFDADSTTLDLVVSAAEDLEVALAGPPPDVACLVKSPLCRVGGRPVRVEELLLCLRRVVVVPCLPDAADGNLARERRRRDGRARGVDNCNRVSGSWLADVHARAARAQVTVA